MFAFQKTACTAGNWAQGMLGVSEERVLGIQGGYTLGSLPKAGDRYCPPEMSLQALKAVEDTEESGAETVALIFSLKEKIKRQGGLYCDPSIKRAVKSRLGEGCIMHVCDTNPLMDVDMAVGNLNLRLPDEQ